MREDNLRVTRELFKGDSVPRHMGQNRWAQAESRGPYPKGKGQARSSYWSTRDKTPTFRQGQMGLGRVWKVMD